MHLKIAPISAHGLSKILFAAMFLPPLKNATKPVLM